MHGLGNNLIHACTHKHTETNTHAKLTILRMSLLSTADFVFLRPVSMLALCVCVCVRIVMPVPFATALVSTQA